jgi:hypothetical protein
MCIGMSPASRTTHVHLLTARLMTILTSACTNCEAKTRRPIAVVRLTAVLPDFTQHLNWNYSYIYLFSSLQLYAPCLWVRSLETVVYVLSRSTTVVQQIQLYFHAGSKRRRAMPQAVIRWSSIADSPVRSLNIPCHMCGGHSGWDWKRVFCEYLGLTTSVAFHHYCALILQSITDAIWCQQLTTSLSNAFEEDIGGHSTTIFVFCTECRFERTTGHFVSWRRLPAATCCKLNTGCMCRCEF